MWLFFSSAFITRLLKLYGANSFNLSLYASIRLSIPFVSPLLTTAATLFSCKNLPTWLRLSFSSSCVCLIFWLSSWYSLTAYMTPAVAALMMRPGSPPIADQMVAPRVFAPVPIILKAANADVLKFDHTVFNDMVRMATSERNNSIRNVFSPVCLRTMPRYVLYCSAVICPDKRSWFSFSVVNALALANARKSAPVIWFFVASILCSTWLICCPCNILAWILEAMFSLFERNDEAVFPVSIFFKAYPANRVPTGIASECSDCTKAVAPSKAVLKKLPTRLFPLANSASIISQASFNLL